jgi:uncharacterized protein (TIGR03086 family)
VELLPIYRSAVRQFDARLRAVGDAQWAAKTPDTEWDVRDLVAHVIDGQHAVAGVIDAALAARQGHGVGAAGLNPNVGAAGAGAPTGSPDVGGDPVGAWEQASGAAVQALSRPGALDGEVPDGGGVNTAVQYGWRAAAELTVHAWDLARATNGVDEFPNDLIGEVLQHAKSSYDQWYSSERYAPSIPVPGCTDDLIELLALTGRNRWWRPA